MQSVEPGGLVSDGRDVRERGLLPDCLRDGLHVLPERLGVRQAERGWWRLPVLQAVRDEQRLLFGARRAVLRCA
jgi:hypothetical protein